MLFRSVRFLCIINLRLISDTFHDCLRSRCPRLVLNIVRIMALIFPMPSSLRYLTTSASALIPAAARLSLPPTAYPALFTRFCPAPIKPNRMPESPPPCAPADAFAAFCILWCFSIFFMKVLSSHTAISSARGSSLPYFGKSPSVS